MKIVILGAGRRGIRLARFLVEEQNDVILIDDNPGNVAKALTSVDCLAFECSGTNIDDLASLEIRDADAFIALTGSDETNLVSCGIVSSNFNIPVTIASVRNLSYTNTDSIMGITHIVNPYQEVARHIWKEIDKGIYSDVVMFEHSALLLNNVFVDENSPYQDMSLKDIRKNFSGNFVIAALSRDEDVMVPSGDTVIKKGDTLGVIADNDSLEDLFHTEDQKKQRSRKICIVGGTKITDFLLHDLTMRQRRNTTVIIKDPEFATDISSKYPEVLTINDNIINEGLFAQENLDNNDVMVCITDNDELNIISASYAKTMGIKNSMALIIKNPDYLRMTRHMGIDSLISSQDVTVDSILKYLHGKNISSMHKMFDGRLETFEFKVPADSPLIGKKLMDINMKEKGIIGGVTNTKDKSNTIPTGTYEIRSGDILLLITLSKSNMFIQNLLSGKES
ncbi:MAG: Trk system potassium transporter TrkA [Sphaerochaetaceae bacterium]|nr:Trk system potassium transporter TrkA [Sphaerochaetaceae bacterium]